MKYIEKIKPTIEWIISIVLKLRLRKTYWSIAAPIGLFLLSSFASDLDPVIKIVDSFYENAHNGFSKTFWGIIAIYCNLSLPWWSYASIIALLLLFTFIYYKELQAKRLGYDISVKNISDSIFDKISEKIDQKVNEIKSTLLFCPDSSWFENQCSASIIDLGKRYTPELNFELDAAIIFDGLGRTTDFEKTVTKEFDTLIIKGKKTLKEHPETKESIKKLQSNLENVFKIFQSINFCDNLQIPVQDFVSSIEDMSKVLYELEAFYREEESKIQEEKKDYHYYHKYGSEIKNVREFDYELSRFLKLLNSNLFRLANTPFLILDGEAGIGKSHMLADIVSKRMSKGYESILFLGQHFVTDEDPWTQIFKRLKINTQSDAFLSVINERGKETGKRIVLFIDAINEGKGKYFWNDNIKSFINEIHTYEWLGLVLTVRTSYKELILPKTEIASIGIIEHTSYGFRNFEYEASKLFFNNYNIELPNIPLLHPEFQNPLFLKLFCEGINKSGLTKIPDGLQGITSIINFFVKNVNEILSKPKRFDYSNGLNLVIKSIDAVIQYKIEYQLRYVPYEKAIEIVEDVISKFVTKKGVFLDELISEGVFSKNMFWKSEETYEEGIYLAYERFEDHLTCQTLLEKYPNLEDEFKENGKLFEFIKEEHEIYRNKGLIDAFSIQIPEKNGLELFEYIPQFKDKYPIIESFVESLLWRKTETITEKLNEYVNNFVLKYNGTASLFWETILAVGSIPDHYFNANLLHSYLMSFTLPDRDAWWTQELKNKYHSESSVKRLIDWAWNENDKSHISDESIKLSSITLSWFLTSTNRQLRDCSTKALVSLLQDRISVLIELLKSFKGVNDIYVYERLYAVAYGCALRTNQKDELKELSEYIFETIFKKSDSVYPHILLRDYARGVIEYSYYLNQELSFDINKVRPPYISKWPDSIPTLTELEEKYDNEDYYELWSSVMSFGDFARYTIGTNHNFSDWSGIKKGEIPIDRDEELKKFRQSLSAEQLVLLDALDPIITEESDKDFTFENTQIKFVTAVGRKSEDDLKECTLKFKESISKEKLDYYENEIEPFLDHNNKIINTGRFFDLRIAQRLIFTRVIELGWNPKQHKQFDKQIGTGRGRNTVPHERIGKKYQWIAYYEFKALLADNFTIYERYGSDKKKEKDYQGPWEPFDRDIDPTMLIYKNRNSEDDEPNQYWWSNKHIFNWGCTNKEWVSNFNDLPEFSNLIQVMDTNKEEWLILEGYPGWAEPKKIGEERFDYPYKSLWCQLRSYIIKAEDYEKMKKWAISQNFMGRWMPESGDRYEMFSREYYWSPAQKDLNVEFNEGNDWKNIFDNKFNELVAEVIVTAENFLWETEFDKSKEETISFLKPCSQLYNGMNLTYGRREGEFINSNGELICFASNIYYNSKSFLLIKKAPLLEYLEKNNLNIIWTILGEKQVLGGRYDERDHSRMELSGAYFFNPKYVLEGKLNTKTN